MSNLPVVTSILLVYVALVIAKSILCYSAMHTAMGVIVRKHRADSCIFWLVGLGVGIPLYVLVSLPFILWQEKTSFFVTYSKFRVMREVAGNI